MKTLYNKLHIFGQTMLLVFFTLSVLSLSSCSKETLDYNHPDVDLFVKQLKAGKYSTQSPDGLSNMPKFTSEDIEELLKYAEDLTVIPSFPHGSGILFGRWQAAFGRMHPVDGRDYPSREQCFDGMQDGTYGCGEL